MMRISLRSFDRAAAATTATNERKGFSVVEVIVAMVLLAIAVSSLAALTYSVSQSAMIATGNAYRNGVLMQEVNRLEMSPYDSVPAAALYLCRAGAGRGGRSLYSAIYSYNHADWYVREVLALAARYR